MMIAIVLVLVLFNCCVLNKPFSGREELKRYKILLITIWSICESVLGYTFYEKMYGMSDVEIYSVIVIIPFILLYTWVYYSELNILIESCKPIKKVVYESVIILVISALMTREEICFNLWGYIMTLVLLNLFVIKKGTINGKIKFLKYAIVIGSIIAICGVFCLFYTEKKEYTINIENNISQNASQIYKTYQHNNDESLDQLADFTWYILLLIVPLVVNSIILLIFYTQKRKKIEVNDINYKNEVPTIQYFNSSNNNLSIANNTIQKNNEFIEEMAKLAGCKKLNMYSDDVYQAKKDELIKGLTKVVILENKETFMVPLLPLFEEKLLTQGDIDNISEIFDKKDTLRKLNNDELIELFVNNEDLKEYIITEAGKRGVTAEYLEKYKELNLLEDDSLLTVYCMPLKITNLKNDYSKIIAKEIFFKRGIDVDELLNYKKKLPELSDYKIIEIYKEDKSKLIDIIDENNRVKAEEKKNLKEAQQKIRQEKIEKINNNLNQNINDAKKSIKIQFLKIFKKLKEVIKNPKVINATLIVATVVMMLSSVNIIYKRVIKKNIITNEIVNESMSNEKIDDKFTIDSDIKILNQYYNGNTGIAEVNATADVTDGSSINKELKITLWYKKENGKWVEEDRNYAIK